MAWVATAIIGAGALGAGAQIFSAKTAADAQKSSTNSAINAEMAIYNANASNLDPFITAGTNALPTLQKLITPGEDQTSTLSQIPGFKFAQDWGSKAIQNLGTTRGLGGNVLKAGADYATGVAQQGWGAIVNALQGLVNTGEGAGAALAGVGATTGGQVGGQIVGAGNARAASDIATGQAVGGFGNSVTTAAILQKLAGNNGMYANRVDAGAAPGVGSGGFNFLDAAAG